MDRLWTVLVFVAVLGWRGAAARDKANMPRAKQEEGQSTNATAMRTVLPEPSAGGRIDPELLARMYNRSTDVPIGREPTIALDGATVANLSRKAALASNTSTKAITNGTHVKGDNMTSSAAGNTTISLDGPTSAPKGGLLKKTNVSASESIARTGLGSRYQGKIRSVHIAPYGEPVGQLGNRTWAQIGPLPNTTNVVSETLASAGNWTAHLSNTARGHMGTLPHRTWAQIGPLPNTTNVVSETLASAGNWTAHLSNTTRGHMGTSPHNSDNAPGVQVTEATQGQMGPLVNASASTPGVAVDVPAYLTTEDGVLNADANSEEPSLKKGPQPGNDYNGESLWTKATSAFNRSLENDTNDSPPRGSLYRPVENGYAVVNVEAAVERYRLAPGAEPQASANRSSDPDVVAVKEIALVVLDGSEETAVIMTDVVIRSVLPDAENGTTMRDTELHKTIRGKFEDEDLMKGILEGDADQAPERPQQGPCETCLQPVSVVCSLCWPADFCRPFASRVDIPCPVEDV